MARASLVQAQILVAIERVERHGLAMTLDNIYANLDVDSLTFGDVRTVALRYTRAQIPKVLKARGYIIADPPTGLRKAFWQAGVAELEEQRRLKQQGTDYDILRLACDDKVIAFLREKRVEFGYEVCPDLFHEEIERIYAMHGLGAP